MCQAQLSRQCPQDRFRISLMVAGNMLPGSSAITLRQLQRQTFKIRPSLQDKTIFHRVLGTSIQVHLSEAHHRYAITRFGRPPRHRPQCCRETHHDNGRHRLLRVLHAPSSHPTTRPTNTTSAKPGHRRDSEWEYLHDYSRGEVGVSHRRVSAHTMGT